MQNRFVIRTEKVCGIRFLEIDFKTEPLGKHTGKYQYKQNATHLIHIFIFCKRYKTKYSVQLYHVH